MIAEDCAPAPAGEASGGRATGGGGGVTRTLYLHRAAGAAPLADRPGDEPRAFHRALAGYAPTPLLEQPQLAAAPGAGRVDIKLETDRLGLPSFKIMGASWATIAALRPRLPSWWTPDQGLHPLAGAADR